MNEFWKKFQEFVGQSIPNEIVQILIVCGYDNAISVSELSEEEITIIERYVNQASNAKPILENTKQYASLEPFVFLPGHKKLIIVLAKKAKAFEAKNIMNKASDITSSSTFFMKELIKSMQHNCNVEPTGRRYSEAIQWFSTYIYMMSGKSAYEVLSSNLPLPHDSTIRTYLKKINGKNYY